MDTTVALVACKNHERGHNQGDTELRDLLAVI